MTPFKPACFSTYELRQMGFAHVGENVRISATCEIYGESHISIGDNVRIDGPTVISAGGGGISIGRNVHIGGFGFLTCRGGISIGDFSALSQGVRIYTVSDDYSGGAMVNPTVPEEFTNVTTAPVAIGRHVLIGSGCVVLPGACLDEGVAVGAMSLVKTHLPAWGLYAGIPARFIRKRETKPLDLEKALLESGA